MIQPQSASIPATANTPNSTFSTVNPVQPGAPSQVTYVMSINQPPADQFDFQCGWGPLPHFCVFFFFLPPNRINELSSIVLRKLHNDVVNY